MQSHDQFAGGALRSAGTEIKPVCKEQELEIQHPNPLHVPELIHNRDAAGESNPINRTNRTVDRRP